MNRSVDLPLVVAITGASGAVYAARLLQCAARANVPTHIVVSPSGAEVIRQEITITNFPNRSVHRCARPLHMAW